MSSSDFESNDHSGTESEEKYQKLSHRKHIRKRPDSYIGSIVPITEKQWVIEDGQFIKKEITYVPGLFKIFDEIIVNAADNKQRDPPMRSIKVNINIDEGFVSVWNDGQGIPIEQQHDKLDDCDYWIPEFIFGHLLTSSNFDDDRKKVTGGRNGYGAKLANVFSTEFIVEVCNVNDKKLYIQKFSEKMKTIHQPQINKLTSKEKRNYTKITFYPDFAKFGMTSFKDNDTVLLMYRRVYDLTGILEGISIYLNSDTEKIPIHNWTEYCRKFFPGDDAPLIVYEDKNNPRWKAAIAPSKGDEQRQMSFVNSVATTKGGTHVKYISDQVEKFIVEYLGNSKPKIKVKPVQVRRCLTIFVNCLIENPTFDSQTKENMTLKASSFGSTCQLPDSVLNKIKKSPIIELIRNIHDKSEKTQLGKMSGSKVGRLNIKKLDDANEAGKRNSKKCVLILTEGDSAKSMAVTGLSIVGRDFYGVFPLRGKLLNTRDASTESLAKNEEIQNIIKIVGLRMDKTYEDGIDSLRYGKIMIMTDQDQDGSHIKGLIINFLHSKWPALIRNNGFLCEFVTPIIKATKGKEKSIAFYTIPEFLTWKREHNNGKGYRIKYYKGLATSTSNESREYFKDFDRHQISFAYQGQEDEEAIQKAFSRKRADDRKNWLADLDVDSTYLGQDTDSITYTDFVDRELILFSHYANVRAIPSVIDGLKPGQRKILWVVLKNNIVHEIKVVQLSGKVSEQSSYHHGEDSLSGTIIGMAQNFVGSNNLNLLYPSGGFGTRLSGGKDSGSARYIFTNMMKITRTLFHKDDDQLLNYLADEGQMIEPKYYVPIVPMVLINGSTGIGMGWSSSVPCYHPLEVIENVRRKIRGEEMLEMIPWYCCFQGKIEKMEEYKFSVTGIIERVDDTNWRISELPVQVWTEDYKIQLQKMCGIEVSEKAKGPGKEKGKPKKTKKAQPQKKKNSKETEDDKEEETEVGPTGGPKILDFKEYHSDVTVEFLITVSPEQNAAIENVGPEKYFKLQTTFKTSNMTLFGADGKIKQYKTPLKMIDDFYSIRLELYDERRLYMIEINKREYTQLSNQARFIKEVNEGTLTIQNRPVQEVLEKLVQRKYDPIFQKSSKKPKKVSEEVVENEEGENEEGENEEPEKEKEPIAKDDLRLGYKYLLEMKMISMTHEKYMKLLEQCKKLQDLIDELTATDPKDMWLADLIVFESAWKEFQAQQEKQREKCLADIEKTKSGIAKKKSQPRKPREKKSPIKPKPKPPSQSKSKGTIDEKKSQDEEKKEVLKEVKKRAPPKTQKPSSPKVTKTKASEKKVPLAKGRKLQEPQKASEESSPLDESPVKIEIRPKTQQKKTFIVDTESSAAESSDFSDSSSDFDISE